MYPYKITMVTDFDLFHHCVKYIDTFKIPQYYGYQKLSKVPQNFRKKEL